MGWKITKELPDIKKCIIIVAPHTSNWDFVIGVFARCILASEIKYLGKKSLFKPPYGWIFYGLGGYPVDRSTSKNMVETVAEIFNKEEEFKLALAPEGTRSQVKEWRTGFYHMAVAAQVPIVSVGFDYAHKTIVVFDPFYPTGDIVQDMPIIKDQFANIRGRNR